MISSTEQGSNTQIKEKKDSKILVVILLAAFVDVLGFSIIIPILPFWVTSLGGNEIVLGILMASFSFFQFIFAPLWGKLSDKVGRKRIFMIGLFGSFIGFFMLIVVAVYVNTIEAIFFVRMVEGIFTSATLPTAYAYLGDISTKEQKTARFGFVGAAAGLGLTLGPFIGGVSKISGTVIVPSTNGYWAPALISTLFALVNLVIGYKYLYETQNLAKLNEASVSEKSGLKKFISKPILIIVIVVLASVSIAFSNMESILALFGMERIQGFSELDTGILFLLVGVILIITQGLIVGQLSKKVSDSIILVMGLLLLSIGFYLAIFTDSIGYMLIVAVPISSGIALVSPSAISLLSKSVLSENQGQIMGINESIGALTRIFGPLLGTGLFAINSSLPWILASLILLSVMILFVLYSIISTKRISIDKNLTVSQN